MSPERSFLPIRVYESTDSRKMGDYPPSSERGGVPTGYTPSRLSTTGTTAGAESGTMDMRVVQSGYAHRCPDSPPHHSRTTLSATPGPSPRSYTCNRVYQYSTSYTLETNRMAHSFPSRTVREIIMFGSSNFGGNRGPRDFGPREMTKVVCSDCGKECEVPFKPTEGRPVYCRDCLPKHRKPRF